MVDAGMRGELSIAWRFRCRRGRNPHAAMSSAAWHRLHIMSSVTCQISISLDGFVAGPDQSVDDPIGVGGMRLHEWVFATDSWRAQHGEDGGEHNADAEIVEATDVAASART